MPQSRELYFHEDDYCQQQLLPMESATFVEAELKKIHQFSDAHFDGAGWTDMYVRENSPVELCTRKINKEEFASIVSLSFPPFDAVFTGYSSYREPCERTAGWGISNECALFANWDDNGIIQNIWTSFFEDINESIAAATGVIAALGTRYSLLYVDWAWGYVCAAQDTATFASRLRSKFESS